jgi:hypothetical protein
LKSETEGAPVDPSSTVAAARQHAVDSAGRLRRERALAFSVVAAVALGGAVVWWLAPVVGGSGLIVGGWLALSAAAAGWLALTLAPRRPRRRSAPESGVAANVVDEPRLHEWAAQLSRRLGVAAPDAIRIAPAAGAWIDQLEDEPTLVIGAGTLGWLTQEELARVVGLELAMLRVRDEDAVVSALRIAASVDADRLARCATPVVGPAVRMLGRRIADRADELRDACVAWAVDEAPGELTPTDDDLHEAELIDEAWTLLEDRWLAPARQLGMAVDSLVFAHRDLLALCEENDLVERAYVRDGGPAAIALVSDAEAVDAELAGWTAARDAATDGIVAWDEYPQRVTLPLWRQTAADAIVAVAAAGGRGQPSTIDALTKALDSGLGSAFGAAIVDARRRRADPDAEPIAATEQEIAAAVDDAVAQSVCLALVEADAATPALDLLWGVGLVGSDGGKLDVEANVRGFLAAGDVGGLRWYLQSIGVDTSAPLPVDGVTALASLPEGMGLVAWRGWRAYDVVVSGGSLLGFRHTVGAQLRGLFSRLTGSYEELVELDPDLAAAIATDDLEQLPRAQLAVDLDVVTSAELNRSPRGSRWTVRLATAGDTIRIAGVGDGSAATRLLEPLLGDRLQHTGLSLRPQRLAAAMGRLSWYTICGGILVLLAGSVGVLQALNEPRQNVSSDQLVQVALTFGVFGLALIGIGLVPYRVIARRARPPGLR